MQSEVGSSKGRSYIVEALPRITTPNNLCTPNRLYFLHHATMRYNPRRNPSPEGSSVTREIDLATAISEIKQACEETEDGKSPFFIIAGAGISAPIIPLASEIARECKEIAAKHNRTAEPVSKLLLDSYSHWFEIALPQARQRQRFFKERIVGKPISHANFRLAHLLSEKRLATVVVTPNFDDFLPRALTLFGVPHIICDHPNTVERIDPESPEVQIVHVHGTYWFYDGCNLRGEIEARTEDSRERAVTMTSLLGSILSRHSAIVIGYAGWEGDVIMTALKRRLQSRLPNNLYWFCYRRSDAEALPDWLKNHRDVRIVLPAAPLSKPDSQPASAAKLATTAADAEPTLTAQSVLDKLVGAFTEKSPALTLDPIGFFADQLKNSFPQDPSEKPGEDIYDLRNVIRRVKLVREAGENVLSPIEAELERIRDAVRRSAYPEALQAASQLESEHLGDAQRETLMESVMAVATGLGDNSEAELRGYDLVLRLIPSHATEDPRMRQRIAAALYNKGFVLAQLNRTEEAIQVYDEVLRRFGGASEPALREPIVLALFNKAFGLGKLKRREEAIQVYDEVLRRFGDTSDPALREQVAKCLFNKGVTLRQLNRSEQQIETYREVLRRFGEDADPELQDIVDKVKAQLQRLGK
jgi:tetratricopeptide (TPR) repeat protein